MTSGYSGKPLAVKLGIGEGVDMLAINPPAEYAQWLAPLPPGARIVTRANAAMRFVHCFSTERTTLVTVLKTQRERL